MIRAENIIHRYGQDTILHGIDLEIEEKAFAVITGESGSGKSTLLAILSTLLTPSSGSVSFDGIAREKIKDIDTFRNTRIGFVFQFHYLIPHLTIYQNIAVMTKRTRKEIMEVLKMLDIAQLHGRYPEEISGGQRQRAAIARAIVNRPKYLFADEPTGNLDSRNSDNVFSILREMDMTVLIATHDTSRIHSGDLHFQMKDGYLCQ